jgi:molecular chaperone HscB
MAEPARPAECPRCAAPLTSALLCEACGALLEPQGAPTPFEVFGLAPAHALDLAALRKRLLRLSRGMHPDYFASADAPTRALAEHNSARLNAAFELLSDEAARASWLIDAWGGPSETQERAMPQEFLLEVLDWNEQLEAARENQADAAALARLAPLEAELRQRRAAQLARVAAALGAPQPAASAERLAARRALNAVRYVDRALGELSELKLARA